MFRKIHTYGSVAKTLSEGLANGTIVLPSADRAGRRGEPGGEPDPTRTTGEPHGMRLGLAAYRDVAGGVVRGLEGGDLRSLQLDGLKALLEPVGMLPRLLEAVRTLSTSERRDMALDVLAGKSASKIAFEQGVPLSVVANLGASIEKELASSPAILVLVTELALGEGSRPMTRPVIHDLGSSTPVSPESPGEARPRLVPDRGVHSSFGGAP